jgi:NAD(P)-dependent dehydrogenase (short-subunit alcohol dehydrogenase family)
MVPISRLNEVIADRKKLEDKVTAMEAAEKAEVDKRLIEQSEFKKLAESRGEELVKAQAEAAKVAGYEKTLTEVLAAQVEALPKDKRALVPEALTTQGKLDWLAKNAAILKAPAAFDIGAGHLGGGEDTTPPVLSPEEEAFAANFGMKKEEYAKNR